MISWNRPTLHWYVLAVTSAAIALMLSSEWRIPDDELAFRNALTAFIILGLIAEAGFVRIRSGSTSSSSVAFVPFLAAVVLFSPAWVMLIGGATQLIAETLIRRKPAIKVIHNAAKEVLSVGLAALSYGLVAGVPSLHSFAPSAPGFLIAVLVYFTANQGATATAISLNTGTSISETWRQVVGGSLLYDFVSGPIALLLAFLYIKAALIGILIVTVPLFIVRHLYTVTIQLEQVNKDLLELMVKAIEARDPYTSGHSLRVSKLARAMAGELSLSVRRVEEIATAALLHDVGKIYEEFATLLRKEGKLLPHEQQMMQSHPVKSAELVNTISTLRGEVELAVRHHHESFNGTGYPDGISGDEIPLGSRIIAIADTVDAMTTDRPYRKALPYERVTQELQMFRGRQFDPGLVDLFCSSARIQAVVDAHLRRPELPQPKTIAQTFDDLRQALGYVPATMSGRASTRWQRGPARKPIRRREDGPDSIPTRTAS